MHLTALVWQIDRIARFMGRTETATGARMSRTRLATTWYRRKALLPTAKRRACMCCQRPFLSEGIHNRICEPCKRSDLWD
jgi:hypothetical protein